MKKNPTKKSNVKIEDGRKVYQSKVLYKSFSFCTYNMTREEKRAEENKTLKGPFAKKEYYGNLGVLTSNNAKGFITSPITAEKLDPCSVGYHAFEKREKANWVEPQRSYHQRIYKIRLFNCFKYGNKWVGDQFVILQRVKVSDLSPRRWRD